LFDNSANLPARYERRIHISMKREPATFRRRRLKLGYENADNKEFLTGDRQ
jgi:hypothetical protein